MGRALELLIQGKDGTAPSFASVKRRVSDLKKSLGGSLGGLGLGRGGAGFMDILEGKALGRDVKQLISGALSDAASGKLKGLTTEQHQGAKKASEAFDKMDQAIKRVTLSAVSLALPALEKLASVLETIASRTTGNIAGDVGRLSAEERTNLADPRSARAVYGAKRMQINKEIADIAWWDPHGGWKKKQLLERRKTLDTNIEYLDANMAGMIANFEAQKKATADRKGQISNSRLALNRLLGRDWMGGALGGVLPSSSARWGMFGDQMFGPLARTFGAAGDAARRGDPTVTGWRTGFNWLGRGIGGAANKLIPGAVDFGGKLGLDLNRRSLAGIFSPWLDASRDAKRKRDETPRGRAPDLDARESRFLTMGRGKIQEDQLRELKSQSKLLAEIKGNTKPKTGARRPESEEDLP